MADLSLLAKIRIKFGENEIEVDSRDFYVDNQTIGQIIDTITQSMLENRARMAPAEPEKAGPEPGLDALGGLEDAEAFEPEFAEPEPVSISQIREKLRFLESKQFFDTPRTVSETVEQLREHGWIASLLDVSKTLAKMAFSREILKNSREQRNYYFVKKAILST